MISEICFTEAKKAYLRKQVTVLIPPSQRRKSGVTNMTSVLAIWLEDLCIYYGEHEIVSIRKNPFSPPH
jgi:hypothetical protein